MAASAPPVLVVRRERRQIQAFRERLAPDRDPALAITLIEIPAGSFVMGSPSDESERFGDEGPQHKVTLDSFLMSQTPITQAQWREVAQWQPREGEQWERELRAEPSFFQPSAPPEARGIGDGRFKLLNGETSSDQRPVDNVSWLDAMEFCRRLSQRTGRTYTLPSEAQWEYACRAVTRAGTTTPFHFGATITPELANYNGKHAYANGPTSVYRQQTTPVGSYTPNRWGLRDMHGNVWEWCLDHWHANYEGAPADGSAWQDALESDEQKNKKERLLRGGSWDSYPRNCRSAFRFHYLPGFAFHYVGFRLVCLPQGRSS